MPQWSYGLINATPGKMRGILRHSGKFSASSAAKQTSGDAAAALSEPLLPASAAAKNKSRSTPPAAIDDSSSVLDEESVYSDDEEPLPAASAMSGKDMFSNMVLSLVVTGGMAAAASAMVVVQSVAVLVMGGLCMVNAPTVAVKQLRIAKSRGIRSSLNDIVKDVELLTDEIKFLSDSVVDLQAEADVLVGLEKDLQYIGTQQRTNVNYMVDLVNENEEILNKMKGNLRQTFVAAMAKVIMRSDTDAGLKISMKELPLLSLRLQIQLDPFNIRLDTRKFEAMIREDNSIENVMRFCGDILFEGEDTNSIGDDDSVDSELTFDFETFCQTLKDEDGEANEGETKMTKEEKFSMVTVNEKYSKGSVEVARGRRMTLMPSNSKKDMRRQSILKEVEKRQSTLKIRRASRNNSTDNGGVHPSRHRQSTMSFVSGLVVVRGTSAEC